MKMSSTSVPFTRMFKKRPSSFSTQSRLLPSLVILFIVLLIWSLLTAITIPSHNLYYYIVKPTFAVVEVGPKQTIKQGLIFDIFNGSIINRSTSNYSWKHIESAIKVDHSITSDLPV